MAIHLTTKPAAFLDTRGAGRDDRRDGSLRPVSRRGGAGGSAGGPRCASRPGETHRAPHARRSVLPRPGAPLGLLLPGRDVRALASAGVRRPLDRLDRRLALAPAPGPGRAGIRPAAGPRPGRPRLARAAGP